MDTVTVQENRRKAVEALRNPDVPQGVGGLYDPETGCYCAYGLMGKAAGVDAATIEYAGAEPYEEIDEALGVDNVFAEWIISLNDTQRFTFAAIASCVAAEWDLS